MVKERDALDPQVFGADIEKLIDLLPQRNTNGIPSFNLLLCLELVKKFSVVVVGGGWWWWC